METREMIEIMFGVYAVGLAGMVFALVVRS